jgi:hypothetical protein
MTSRAHCRSYDIRIECGGAEWRTKSSSSIIIIV